MDKKKTINSIFEKINFLDDSKMMKNRLWISRAKRLIKKLRKHEVQLK